MGKRRNRHRHKSQGITQEELNGLSPRARKAYEESNSVLSEITIENPNAEKEDKPKKKKEKEDEKF